MTSIGDALIVLFILTWTFLLAGEPDIADAIVHRLMDGSNCE